MSQENVEVVRKGIEAFNRGDLDAPPGRLGRVWLFKLALRLELAKAQ